MVGSPWHLGIPGEGIRCASPGDGFMITFQTVADVTADRRVVLALPPEVPTGKVEIAVAIAAVVAQQDQPPEPRGALGSAALESADSQGEEEPSGGPLTETYPEIRAETREHRLAPQKHAPASAGMEDAGEI